ncbi:MAG: MFS transporter [Candidatus Latescibacterota bacterium]|nr:MFS transporter [Candidatus Latescibacterota bacterium]
MFAVTDDLRPAVEPALTRGDVHRGLRSFITSSGLWGVWGQTVGIGTAVFTGYALHLGADESYIALVTSVAYLLATVQLLSPLVVQRIRRRKRFIIGTGLVEILFRTALPVVPLLFAKSLQLKALLALVALGLLCGYAISPFYNTWVANTVPEKIRARFTSRQTIVSTLVAMAAGIFVGTYIDSHSDTGKDDAFTIVFAVGAVFGWLGYLALGRAPHVSDPELQPERSGSLLEPFRDGNFRRAVMFYGIWTFALGIGSPLYSVYMLTHLGISYTEISIFNAMFMVASIAGYRFWAILVDRYGSKPVLQILMLPTTFIPVIWVLNEPGAYYLVPVALVISGILFSGILVSVTPLLSGLAPKGERRPFYLASWSATVNLLGALGPLTGSYLVLHLEDVTLVIHGFELGSLQLIFLLSAVARVPALLLLGFVSDRSTISSRHLLNHLFRGNLLSYTFNNTVFSLAGREDRRARAALALGRSGSPLAIEQLIHALADASPMVRRSAARALGETASEQATDTLIRELVNGESDIRAEAAEALGRLGHSGSIDPLINALDDHDPRVRISAIQGLREIGGPEVQELLFWYLGESYEDSALFPTLVDVLSLMGDYRIVKPTLQRLGNFRSAAVRLQLLNSICHSLGAQSEFYRLLSLEEDRRGSTIDRTLRRTSSVLTRRAALDVEVREELRDTFTRLIRAHDSANLEWMEESSRQIAGLIRDGLSTAGRQPYEVLSIYLVILALEGFINSEARLDLPEAREIFVAVALKRLGELIRSLEPAQDALNSPPDPPDAAP